MYRISDIHQSVIMVMSAAAVSFINGKYIVLSINGTLSVLDPLLVSVCNYEYEGPEVYTDKLKCSESYKIGYY